MDHGETGLREMTGFMVVCGSREWEVGGVGVVWWFGMVWWSAYPRRDTGDRCSARALGLCSSREYVECCCTASMRMWYIYRCNGTGLEVDWPQ